MRYNKRPDFFDLTLMCRRLVKFEVWINFHYIVSYDILWNILLPSWITTANKFKVQFRVGRNLTADVCFDFWLLDLRLTIILYLLYIRSYKTLHLYPRVRPSDTETWKTAGYRVWPDMNWICLSVCLPVGPGIRAKNMVEYRVWLGIRRPDTGV